MFYSLSATLVALFSLAAFVAAIPTDMVHNIKRGATKSACGSEPSFEEVNQMENAFNSILAGNSGITSSAGSSTIQVVFNVIYASTDYSGGYVSDSQIQDQINVLNQEYIKTGLSFTLRGITRTLNVDWFNNVSPENDKQTAMKNALRQGDVKTLNVYTVSFDNDDSRGLLGYSTFPASYRGDPKDDGVVLQYATLPGGSEVPFNLGRILVHEVGHWVGLLHTFQDGCKGPGDYVDDTPAEAYPSSGCPIGRDTCPSPGSDPVQNHMDYSDDECRIEFTPGQITRLQSQVRAFRGISV